MNDLMLSHEPATGQVVIDGRPAGPAGEAGLTPAEGVDLAFDRADGHLVRVDRGCRTASPRWPCLPACSARRRRSCLRSAKKADAARPFPLSPDPGVGAALSGLARLDAARATSPVAASPWWAAEAAVLAQAAGLRDRALADALRAVRALSQGGPLAVPGKPPARRSRPRTSPSKPSRKPPGPCTEALSSTTGRVRPARSSSTSPPRSRPWEGDARA